MPANTSTYSYAEEAARFYKSKKNRQCQFGYDQVITDGRGNILSRPLVRSPKLECFGIPHDYHLGISDRPVVWNSNGIRNERPRGCAGCPVRPACGFVVLERTNSLPALASALSSWESTTARMGVKERYAHPTWTEFALLCRQHHWTDHHDELLAEYKRKQADKKQADRKKARKDRKKSKLLDPALVQAIQAERDRRAVQLKSLRLEPSAPRYVTKLDDAGCDRTADVWAEREIRERTRQPARCRAIADAMLHSPAYKHQKLPSLATRVSEAFRRIEQLEREGIWSGFQAPVRNRFTP